MAEWLYEAGIGENRAALVAENEILEAQIELPGQLRAGSVVAARLARILVPGRRGIAAFSGGEALIEPLPPSWTEGAAVHIEILREAIPEAGRTKLPKCRITEAPEGAGPSLHERLLASGARVTALGRFDPDRLDAAGWSELLEQALTGEIGFGGGALRMSLTPAMTLFDVDGALPAGRLAIAGAEAAGRTIRRLGIGGSIGIDLPTLSGREQRQAVARALDAVLPQPFERTAVNGFGFLQVVRKRERPSLPELLRGDPAGAAARNLLRQAERCPGSGPVTLHADPAVAARIEAVPAWWDSLQRLTGGRASIRVEPERAIWSGYVNGGP